MKTAAPSNGRKQTKAFCLAWEYAMTEAEVARKLGISVDTVHRTAEHALKKMRARLVSATRFRDAVNWKRRSIDSRTSMQPWADIDADVEI